MTKWSELLSALHRESPWDEGFSKRLVERITQRCEAVPVNVHKIHTAEVKLEEACREAIVEVYQETYVDAWFPIMVKKDWPIADCIINADGTASLRFAISPEMDALLGGNSMPRIVIKVKQPPPNILQRMVKNIRRGEPADLAPIGRPDKPKLDLARSATPAAPARPNMVSAGTGASGNSAGERTQAAKRIEPQRPTSSAPKPAPGKPLPRPTRKT